MEIFNEEKYNELKMRADQLKDADSYRELGIYLSECYFDRYRKEAIFWLTKASETGDVEAEYQLGKVYNETPFGVNGSRETAMEWFEKAAEKGHPGAMYALSGIYFSHGNIYHVENAYEKARQLREEAAQLGFSEAELDKAHNYVESWNPYYLEPGDPKVKDRDQYLYWLTRAADHGSVKAERELAWVCYAGKVTNRDLDKAIFYLEKAASQGDKDAIFELEYCKIYGQDEAPEFKAFVFKALKKAEEGDKHAIADLAKCYREGRGCVKDEEKAFYWASQAAKKDPKEYTVLLGDCYYYGIGVQQDYKKAFELYREQAKAWGDKDEISCERLAECYRTGHGVERDEHLAEVWTERSFAGQTKYMETRDE